MSISLPIRDVIQEAIAEIRVVGKCGRKTLQPKLICAINKAGYEADGEDTGRFLSDGMPVWRSKDTGMIEVTKARRRIDIVVRSDGHPIALIETESDLNDLKKVGTTRRNGHYDVFSIARASDGTYFHSYKSLERMAAAAFYFCLQQDRDQFANPEIAASHIAAVRSDKPVDHNPKGLELFLVSGSCRKVDQEILEKRLSSLNAHLIAASFK